MPKTGEKFVVNQDVKDTTFSPGSTAFMSYMTEPDVDYQDVARIKVVVVRRGKGGMDRVNLNNLHVPIFRDPRMMEHENYLPIGRKYYVHVDKERLSSANVLELDDIDFLGWACAKACYIYYLTTHFAKKNIPSLWPQSNKNPVVVASRFTEYFESDPGATVKNFSENKDFREHFIAQMRTLESAGAKSGILYHKRVVAAILNSAKFMVYTNDKYFPVTDKAEAENSVKYYEERLKWLDKMTMKPVKKNS